MAVQIDTDALQRHQQTALTILSRCITALDQGPQAVLAASETLRRDLGEALGAYQQFKHQRIFDPAIESGDDVRATLGRHMKVSCIAAGEVFRAHMRQWTPERIENEWSSYQASARLTANQLRRHIVSEGEGIADLIATYH
jgi:hypothetical protein